MNEENKKVTPRVTYKNQIDELGIGTMSATQLNAYFAILSTFKNVTSDTVRRDFTFSKFRNLANLPTNYIRNEKMQEFLDEMSTKITAGTISINTYKYSSTFVLFERMDVDKERKTISVVMSQSCVQYFNRYLQGVYTSFPLIELLKLKGKYAKLLYKTLQRRKYNGHYTCDYNDFINNILCVPETLKRHKVAYAVLNPAIKELQDNGLFKDMKVFYSYDENNKKQIKDISFVFNPKDFENTSNENLPFFKGDEEFDRILKDKDRLENTDQNRPFCFYTYLEDFDIWELYFNYPTLKEAKECFGMVQLKENEKYKITELKDNGEEVIVDTNVSAEELENIGKGVAEELDNLPF
ncbi:MAG: replication initiation protein [Bacilli bacterium]|nr:replication initiation protein [Bacilli bacterium]